MAAIKKPKMPKQPKKSSSIETKQKYVKRLEELTRDYKRKIAAAKKAHEAKLAEKRKGEMWDKKVTQARSRFCK